jgi:hypothetical protein
LKALDETRVFFSCVAFLFLECIDSINGHFQARGHEMEWFSSAENVDLVSATQTKPEKAPPLVFEQTHGVWNPAASDGGREQPF